MTTSATAATNPTMPGTAGLRPGDVTAGRYEIVRLLGEGGMGAVFEVRHKILGKSFAMKVLRAELTYNDQFTARFLQEARSATEVRHRNIVEIVDFGVDDGRHFMVMEYLQGEPLSALIKREAPLPPGRIVALLEPVTRALAVAHDKGVVHRDIKPDNIFLVREEDGGEITPKVVDFGIAKRTMDENVQLTAASTALGTPAYMAPEQVMSARDVSGAADQYALGVTLYQALSARMPHEAETVNGMIVAKVTQEPPSLAKYRPDLDPSLVAIVMRMLARRPEDRFPSMLVLREALLPFVGDAGRVSSVRPGPLAPSTPTVRGVPEAPPPAAIVPSSNPQVTPPELTPVPPPVTVTPAHVTPPAVTQPAAPPPAPMPRWVWATGALVVVLAGSVGGWLALRPSPAPAPARAPERPPAEASVVFQIHVEPATARITLDGEEVGMGRAEVTRPRDNRRHQLVVSAPGYVTISEVLTAGGDVRLDRELRRLEPTAPATPERAPVAVNVRERPSRTGRGATPERTATAQPTLPPTTPTAPTTPQERPQEPPRRPVDPRHPQIDRDNPFGS